jgi:hypothetical protein
MSLSKQLAIFRGVFSTELGYVASSREERNAKRILVGKPEGKRLLGRPSYRKKDNIRIYFKKLRQDGMDWIDLAQAMEK